MVKIKLLKPWMAHREGAVIDVHGVEADLLAERGYAERVTEGKALAGPPETTALHGPPETKTTHKPKTTR